jgi:hypothetical protein
MKRNKALNEATRVACNTRKIALAETADARPAAEDTPLERPFEGSNKLPQNQSDILTSAYEYRDTRQLLSYVHNLIDNIRRDASNKASPAQRRKPRFDFSLRCLDEVPRIS